SGRIDVLLHAAGMERSHLLRDKDPKEFDLIFDVKADGFFHLLHAIGDMPLGATVVFSSIAGRFGNAGQTDYSSANDLLCKITSSFRTTRKQKRAIAIDWTAGAGIGMASRGSIPKMMELAGIDMLPAEAGIPLIRRELTAGGTKGEVVVGQRLGLLLHEWEEDGGLDPAAAGNSTNLAAKGPMIGKMVAGGVYIGTTMETTLDPKAQPFLYDHQIEGTPVLPGVMGVEAFAEAARCLAPGWQVESVEDVNFLAPFKFYRHEPRTITVRSVIRSEGDALVATCRLIGSRLLPNETEPHETIHFTGRVKLVKDAAKTTMPAAVPRPGTITIGADEIYRVYFHGPAYQVIRQAWRDGDRIIGQFADKLPPNHDPRDLPTLVAPRLVELCFQTAGLWEMGVQGRMGLPLHIDMVRVWRSTGEPTGPVYAIVTPSADQQSFSAEVIDGSGSLCIAVSGYRTVAI